MSVTVSLGPMPIDPEKVIAARTALGLSQAALAKNARMTQQSLARIESGVRLNPQLSTAENLARALGVKIDDLLSGTRPRKSKRGGRHG